MNPLLELGDQVGDRHDDFGVVCAVDSSGATISVRMQSGNRANKVVQYDRSELRKIGGPRPPYNR